MRRIDAHQHYWSIERGDYGWLTPENDKLYRDFGTNDLEPELQRRGFDGSVVVQAAATVAETEYLLGIAERTDSVLGVVGWLDLSNSTYLADFERLRKHPKFKGIRVMIQDMPDPTLALSADYIEALRYFASEGLPVDLLVVASQLPVLLKVLEEVPGLVGVIDHLAKPLIASGTMDPWKDQMRVAASHPNIHCKLSGMVTEAKTNWAKDDFVPYVEHVVEQFGFDRVMYGSDWPVCLLAARYDQVVDVLEHALSGVSEVENAKVFGGNAERFYRLTK